MDKKTIQEEIDIYQDWMYGITLQKAKDNIKQLEKLGVTHIDLNEHANYFYKERLETDEEYTLRINKIKQAQISKRERDLKKLKELAEKYNIELKHN